MRSLSLALVFALFLPSLRAHACTCVPGDRPFLEAVADARVVVVATVTRHRRAWPFGRERYLDLQVDEVLAGPTKLRKLVVTGDNGRECRHYATAFPVGTRWVFALTSYGKPSDLGISRCSESALAIDGVAITGAISKDANGRLFSETTTLEDLKTRLKAQTAR